MARAGNAVNGSITAIQNKSGRSLGGPGAYGMQHLGYPLYFLTIHGVWKIFGLAALLIPRFPLLQEWAYAGFVFAMTGAVFSHIAVGDPVKELFPCCYW